MVSPRAETCLDLPSLSRSGVSVISALVNRDLPCICLSLSLPLWFDVAFESLVVLCCVRVCVIATMLQSSVCYRANAWRCFCGVAFLSFVVFCCVRVCVL